MRRLEGKTVVVTGAARGIGRAISILFAQHGAKVAVTDLLDDEGETLAKEIQTNNGTARFWHLDTAAENEVQRRFQDIHDAFGGLHVLVNNAGISGIDRPTDEIDLASWEEVIRINVTGVFLCQFNPSWLHLDPAGGSDGRQYVPGRGCFPQGAGQPSSIRSRG